MKENENEKNIKEMINNLFDSDYIKEGWFDKETSITASIIDCIKKCTSPRASKKNNPITEDDLKLIFKAFSLFKPSETRVLILGQDPYPESNKAQGLAFSCKKGKAHSLTKIFKAINKYKKTTKSYNYDLANWATKNKILLLNTALTFEKSKKFAGNYKYKKDLSKNQQQELKKDQLELQEKHIECWNNFMVEVIKSLIKKNKNFVVFLWGNKAKDLFNSCNNSKCIIKFETCHPQKRFKKGENDQFLMEAPNHFAACDEIFKKKGLEPIFKDFPENNTEDYYKNKK